MLFEMPVEFILRHARVSWRELAYGFQHGLVGHDALIELALNDVANTEQPSLALIELVDSRPDEPLQELVWQLAESEPAASEDAVRAKWLYLQLAWLYARRDTLPEPWDALDYVHAHYPREMWPFRGPMSEGQLIEQWKQYLDAASSKYSVEADPRRTVTE